MRVLSVNAGSSSIKLSVLDHDDTLLVERDLAAPDGAVPDLAANLSALPDVDAIGHRIVHGGATFIGPTLIDRAVIEKLRDLADRAPLHQNRAIACIEATATVRPDLPAVACFDTALFARPEGLPESAWRYAVPEAWLVDFGIRRYGAHGLAHSYARRRAAELVDARDGGGLRMVTCHLGSGASLTAWVDERPVDTTMGFTPLEGLVMGTRSGTVDPGLPLWLVLYGGQAAASVQRQLEHESGLLGLAGSADMAVVTAAAAGGDARAGMALAVYDHRLRGELGKMVAAAGGLDVLVFSGGIGEHADQVRARACAGLDWLGVRLDPRANGAAAATSAQGPDAEVSLPQSSVRVLVVHAREDLAIAAQVRATLRTADGQHAEESQPRRGPSQS